VSNASHPPDRRLAEKGVLLVAAIATAFSVIAAIIGYIEVGPPVKLAGGILAVGVGYWIFRAWTSPSGFWLPDPWKATVAVLACLLIGATWAWKEALPDRSHFDFVVVPHSNPFVFESLAPQPSTEISAGPSYEYGFHLPVVCHTEGTDGKVWFQLPNHNFLPARDLKRAPLSEDWPPEC
jgi:hypothetical protein